MGPVESPGSWRETGRGEKRRGPRRHGGNRGPRGLDGEAPALTLAGRLEMRGLPEGKAAQSPWGGRTPRAWAQVRTAGLGAGSRVDSLRGGPQPRRSAPGGPGTCEPGREPATVTRWCPPAGAVETVCADWTDRKQRCFSRPCFVTSPTRPVPHPRAGPQAPQVPGQPSLTGAS